MKKIACLLAAGCLLGTLHAQDVRQGLVSYWPLDALSEDGLTTPDAVTGNHMTLTGMDISNLVTGQRGMAMSFNGSSQYLSYTATPGVDSGLPITDAPQFSVLLWVKGLPNQVDRRVFSEGSSATTDPLFNIGTHNTGADGTVDIFIRNSGTKINHYHSPRPAFDDQWHHIAWTDNNGVATLYIDGTVETNFTYSRGPTAINITSIGAILRATPGAYFSGSVDDVAVWERILTEAEIQQVMNSGIQTPVPAFPATVTSQPLSKTNLLVGDSYTLTVAASGTRPLSFQWRKGTNVLESQTSPVLSLSNMQVSDSGTYFVDVTNGGGTVSSLGAEVLVNLPPSANLTNDLIAHWPMETVEGTKTPDVVSGYDMELANLTAADLVPGREGNTFSFVNGRQTMLRRISAAEEQLPINKHESYTISMWVNILGTGQNDLRFFSEGSTSNNDPLFNFGTQAAGADNTIVMFFRNAPAGFPIVDHLATAAQPLDGTWHHIAFVQREGARSLYIDGVLDTVPIPAKPAGTWGVNTTTIGGILRASATHWVTGFIDEVALWKRALTQEEINLVIAEGVPEVVAPPQPLAIRSFTADYPTVVRGDNVTLRWDVNKDATVSINQGIGDVTANTLVGIGSRSVTVTQETTYTLTISRGAESVTQQVTVRVLDGVASGWRLLENFQGHSAGLVTGRGNWINAAGAVNVVDLGVNKVLGYDDGDDLGALNLNSLSLNEGNKATLFFRLFSQTNITPNTIAFHVGLTDKAIRFVTDFNGDIGPYLRVDKFPNEEMLFAAARNGVGSTFSFSPENLTLGQIYDVWIDIENDLVANGDKYTVYYRQQGQPERTLLFDQFITDRNPAGTPEFGLPQPNLTYLVIAAPGVGQGVGNILLDDFYLSSGNQFLATTPIAALPFTQVAVPTEINITSFSRGAGSFTITWSSGAGATYDVLKRNSLSEAWAPVASGLASGGATTTYTDNSATGAAAYYQIRLVP